MCSAQEADAACLLNLSQVGTAGVGAEERSTVHETTERGGHLTKPEAWHLLTVNMHPLAVQRHTLRGLLLLPAHPPAMRHSFPPRNSSLTLQDRIKCTQGTGRQCRRYKSRAGRSLGVHRARRSGTCLTAAS